MISKPAFHNLKAAVTADLAGQRLDKVLALALAGSEPPLSRARLQALIAEGCVSCGGKPADDVSRKVKMGEAYIVRVPPPEAAVPKAEKIPLTVVYEDKDLLVIDKPAGMVVHPAPGNRERTLVNALLAHCGKSLSGIGGVARPGIVHRLDKDTSGLIAVAKNDAAHQALSRQFADRSLSRTYHALVWGVPAPRAGKVQAPVGRHSRDRKKMAVTAKGRAALTHYKVLEAFDDASLVECKLSTGRTHQIRVHLAHIKHPVIGDPVYGRKKSPFPRQALHAVELQLTHPRTGKLMRFKSGLPPDMRELLRGLRAAH